MLVQRCEVTLSWCEDLTNGGRVSERRTNERIAGAGPSDETVTCSVTSCTQLVAVVAQVLRLSIKDWPSISMSKSTPITTIALPPSINGKFL